LAGPKRSQLKEWKLLHGGRGRVGPGRNAECLLSTPLEENTSSNQERRKWDLPQNLRKREEKDCTGRDDSAQTSANYLETVGRRE